MPSERTTLDWRVLPEEAGMRLDRFLAGKLGQYSRTRLADSIAGGHVLVDSVPRKRSFRVEPGQVVRLVAPPPERLAHDLTPAEIPLDVVFEDEHLLVVNKPRGMATHPAPTLIAPSLVNALLARGQALSRTGAAYRPGIVHRLDKETTGLIVVAKSDAAHLSLAKQFERKTARRIYVAVVEGDLERERLRIEAPLSRDPRNRKRMAPNAEGKPAVTHLARLARLERGTLVAARLETGRTHQIRAHCRAIGRPIVGDALYGPGKGEGLPLQLHAALLAFRHPAEGMPMSLYSAPPKDFLGNERIQEEVLERLWSLDTE